MVKYGYNKEQYKKFNTHAWLYLILFSLLYCAHYCTRLNLPAAQLKMPYNESEIGILTGTLFWCYGLGHLVNGRLGEIVGVRKFIILSVILSIGANILMGFQSNVWIMAVIWGFNGYFQSMAWSTGVNSLNQWWPGNKRGFAVGFANAFSGFGQVAATLMVTLAFTLVPFGGWRAAFFIPAIFPLIMVIIYILFAKAGPTAIGLKDYEEPDKEKAEQEAQMAKIVKEKGALYPYLYLLKQPVFLICLFIVFGNGLARYGLVTWIPKYLKEEAGLGTIVGLLTSTILPIGMGIGTLVVPTLTDKFCPNNRLLTGIIGGICAALCVLGFFLLEPTGVQLIIMMICLFFAGFFIYATQGVVWVISADIGGRAFAGTASGILDCASYMGAAVQAYVYGFLLTKGSWSVVFLSVAAISLMVSALSFITTKVKK